MNKWSATLSALVLICACFAVATSVMAIPEELCHKSGAQAQCEIAATDAYEQCLVAADGDENLIAVCEVDYREALIQCDNNYEPVCVEIQ